VFDDSPELLAGAGQESRHIDEGHQGQVKGVAKADEPGCFGRGVDIEDTGQGRRLVGDNPHRVASEAGESGDDVGGIVGLYLQKMMVVDYPLDHLVHIIGLVGISRDHCGEVGIPAVGRVGPRFHRRIFHVVGREETEQFTNHHQGLLLIFSGEMGHPAAGAVGVGPPEFLHGHLLVGDRPDHLRTGDKHMAGFPDHEDEIGQRRGVDGPSGTGPQNYGELGNDPRGAHVVVKNVGITCQALHTLLDAGPTGIIEPY